MIRIAAGSILLVLFLSTTPVRAACSGDVNGDHQINVADVFYLINNLFAGGPAPVGPADVNLDMNVNVSDVFYLINYLFAGGPSPVTACAFGCDVPAGSCADLVPANQAAQNLAGGDVFTCTGAQDGTLPAISVATGKTLTIDTSIDTIVNDGTGTLGVKWGSPYVPAGAATSAVVAHIKSLAVGSSATVAIQGTRALVLLVDQSVAMSSGLVTLNGSLAHGPGPGAPSTVGTGGDGLGFTGAGGGGYGTSGGAGGRDSVGTTGGLAGASHGAGELLDAGASGGAAGAAMGGAGGGGLQVSACVGVTLGPGVVVNASGGGGTGGGGPTAAAGGRGGGSGGTILLEAAAMSLAGSLAANGGGGGGGGDSVNVGASGGEWNPATSVGTAAQGGPHATSGAGGGGNGGAGASTPTNGGNAMAAGNGGGGGGGAVGRISLNVSPTTAAPSGVTSSPAPKISKTCVTAGGAPPVTCSYP